MRVGQRHDPGGSISELVLINALLVTWTTNGHVGLWARCESLKRIDQLVYGALSNLK
jgi:hypothetical protein